MITMIYVGWSEIAWGLWATFAGTLFAWIVLKVATHLDFPVPDRWTAMIFAYLGTVFLIASIRVK